MKKINTLSVQVLKVKQFVAFMMFVKNAVSNHAIVNQWFPFFVNKFLEAYDALDEAFLKYDIDACTNAVKEADTNRDAAFRKMRDSIKWFITYPETEEKTQAAAVLMRVIDLYGGINIPNQGQAAKTATISNLVDDFEKKYPVEVETLGVGTEVEALKAAQAVFDEKYMVRDVCESEIVKGAMEAARRSTTEAYRLLVDAINLKAYEDEEHELDAFINLMNVEVGKNRTYTGQGQVGSTNTGTTEDDESNSKFKFATFKFANGESQKFRIEVGAPLTALPNTEGYVWKPEVPEFMPARNIVFREEPVSNTPEETNPNQPGSGETTPTLYTIQFTHNGQVVRTQQLAQGATVTAPAAPAGYEWVNCPSTMPAHDVTVTTKAVSGGGTTPGEDQPF